MALSYSGFLGFHFNCTGLNMISDSSLVPFDLAQEKIKALVFIFYRSIVSSDQVAHQRLTFLPYL